MCSPCLSCTCPHKWPLLSIQRNREDDFPRMTTWPFLTDFSSSTPGSTQWQTSFLSFLCTTWPEHIHRSSEILTVRRLNITPGNFSIRAHLQVHPSPLIICTKEEETITTVDSGECRTARQTRRTCVEVDVSAVAVKG